MENGKRSWGWLSKLGFGKSVAFAHFFNFAGFVIRETRLKREKSGNFNLGFSIFHN
ncbi:hypothetical protein RND71_010536 [Anisodus tanguticus]|uniref:Uncharacterized protein n=1 Tax=Anisodus tanguticus TaxID=243964 RepID=A0AAE1SLU2_9SOLA|nr:hypothetical protein RND71_010536 [Anisodus tanguticus]